MLSKQEFTDSASHNVLLRDDSQDSSDSSSRNLLFRDDSQDSINGSDDNRDETSPLLFIVKEKKEITDNILIRTASVGLHGLFLAGHMAVNSKLLAMLAPEGDAAGSLVSAFYSCVLNGSIGMLLSTGLELGPLLGKKKYIKAGYVAKSAWLLTGAVALGSSAILLVVRNVLPVFFEKDVALIAVEFSSGYSIVPMLLMTTSSQIAFQNGDWLAPSATMFTFSTLSALFSYLLGFNAKLGAFGVGLGGSFSGIAVAAGLQLWFLRKKYNKLLLYNGKLKALKDNFLNLSKTGLKLSLQRLSEWSNLILITSIIGLTSKDSLNATHPSNVYIILLATLFQGLAEGAGMLIARNRGIMFKDNNEIIYELATELQLHKKNRDILIQNGIFSILVTLSFGTAFFFAQDSLSNFFLSPDSAGPTRSLAKRLLWINLVGLVPDALRITTSGALRGWQDIFFPTLLSLIMIVGLGVPGGYELTSLFDNEAESFFYLRDIAITITAGILIGRCKKKLSQDINDLGASNTTLKEPSCIKNIYRYFPWNRTNNIVEVPEQENTSRLSSYTNYLN